MREKENQENFIMTSLLGILMLRGVTDQRRLLLHEMHSSTGSNFSHALSNSEFSLLHDTQ